MKRTKNTESTVSTLSTWVDSQRTSAAEGTDVRLHLLALRSTVKPSPNPGAVATALSRFLRAALKDPAGKDVIAAYVADERQPGWARLAAALAAGDVEGTRQHARHTAALAARAELKGSLLRADAAAFRALSPVRRVRLAHFGVLHPSGPHLHPCELVSVTAEVARSTWGETPVRLLEQVRWAEVTFDGALEVISALPDGLAEAPRGLELVVTAQRVLHPGHPDRSRAVELLVKAYEKVDVATRPRFGASTAGADTRSFVTEMFRRSERGAHRLAAAAAHSRFEGLDSDTVALLASTPDSAWVLPDLLRSDRGGLVLVALERVLDWAGEKDPTVARLACQIRDVEGSSSRLAKVYPRLGSARWVVAAAAAGRLAPSWGYGDREASEYVRALPDPLKADMVSLSAALVDEALAGTESSSGLSDETFDKARAVLAQQGFVPAGGRVPGWSTALEYSLRMLLLAEARYERGAVAGRDVRDLVEAWLRVLPARELRDLVESGEEYLARCGAAVTMPKSVRTVLDEAVLVVGDGPARAALLASLGGGWESPLPWDQTLTEYAAALRNAAAHAV